MNSAMKDITQFCVPPPDEALAKAIADFKARLAAWTAAIHEAHRQLAEQARTHAEVVQQTQNSGDRQVQLQSELEARVAAQTQTEQDLQNRAQTQSQVEQELKARQEALAEAEQKLHKNAEAQARIEEELRARAEAQAQAAEALEKQAKSQAAFQAQLEEQAAALGQQPPADSQGVPANDPLDWNSENVSKHIRVYGDLAKAANESEPQAEPQEANADEQLLASLDPETAKAIKVMRRVSGDRKSVRELLEQYQATQAGKGDAPKKSWFRRGR